jgi:hypothetical protein
VASYATPLGALPAGVVYRDAAGAFSAVASTAANQVLTSTGVSSFAFVPQQNLPSAPFSYGITQMALTTVGGAVLYPIFNPISFVGNSTSLYNAAAVVLSGTFTPYNPMSTIKVEWAMTLSNSQDFAYANLYLYPAYITSPFASSNDVTFQAGDISTSVKGSIYFTGLSFVDEIPFAICVFKSGVGTTGGINQSDYVLFTEYDNQAPLPPQTASAVLTDATPVTLFSVDLSGSGIPNSRYISGSVIYADAANLISNSQTFQILIQYSSTSNTTTCTVGPGNSLAANPFLTYTIVGNTVSVNAVGLVGETFNTTCNYTFLQGSV